jgi:type I restriction enzyme, S subunit
MSGSPGTWQTLPLAKVLMHSIGGVWGIQPGNGDLDVRVIRVTELKGFGRLEPSTAALRSITRKQFESRQLRPGDLLLEKSGGGPRTPVGRVGLVTHVAESSVCANFMHLLRPDQSQVVPKFLHLYLNYFHLRGGTSSLQVASTNIRNIKASEYLTIRVPVPSLGEQQRIVNILEDHLSRLDVGQPGLQLALKRLASYEQAALANCRDGVSTPLSDVAVMQGGIQKQPRRVPRDNAYPFLRVANVTKDGLALDEVHKIELFGDELEKLRIRRGDLLVVEGNGSQSQIGRAAMWDGSIPDCVHQNHLIRVRPTGALWPEYLEGVWNSPQNRQQLMDLASSSSGLYTLSVSKLRSLSIPVPSIERQEQIVRALAEVRQRRALLTHELDRALGRALRLRRSLLAAAFSGRLTGRSSDLDRVAELTEAGTS